MMPDQDILSSDSSYFPFPTNLAEYDIFFFLVGYALERYKKEAYSIPISKKRTSQ